MGIQIEAHGDRLRYRPQSAMTPAMMEAVKIRKQDLLQMLTPDSLLPGLSGSGSRSADTDAASVPRAKYTTSSNKIDCEFARFERVAVRTETGGLRDPENCSAELARRIRAGGIAFEAVERFETDCGRMGRGARS